MNDPLPEQLYKILACPKCKSDVRYTVDKKALRCANCKKTYPIRDGIPIMLID